MAPKKKQEKMALGDFLNNQSLGSWADEMDMQPVPAASSTYGARDRGNRDDGSERRSFTQPSWESARGGPGGGGMDTRGASYSTDRPRYGDREQLPLPTKPPYTAHLGNLSYDVTSSDIESFLAGCEVTNVRIVEDKLDQKPKGFGYVEFGTLDGLKKALTLSESSFAGRNIKISVAEPPKDRGDASRDLSDWSRKGPLPEMPQNARQPSRGYSGRGFDPAADINNERAGGRRAGFFPEDNKVRDLGSWERKGPLSPAPGAGPPVRDGGRVRESGPPRERRASPSWGGDSDAGSRPPRKEFEPRPQVERAPTAAEQDNQWRSRMRPDPSPVATPEASTPASPAQQAPKERPRLNLAKRTVSTVDPETPGTATDSKASPFGAARPIDTAQREREVEEKREIAVRTKREADEKEKAEKAAAKAERADKEEPATPTAVGGPTQRGGAPRRPSRQQQNGSRQNVKEKEDVQSQPKPSFSILSREGEEDAASSEAAAGASEAIDASANGVITGDKETKPQEITRVVGSSADGGDTAQVMEDDGWSTVASKSKSKGRGGARALAS